MSLPNDIARCPGEGSDAEGWREGCENCRRRTELHPDRVVMMSPPPMVFFCPARLEPDA